MRAESSQNTERWVALDAMRGIAALLVVLYHLRWDWHGFDFTVVRHGFYAVDFFFVLSGFVMAANYSRLRTGGEFASFLVKRAGRLLPLHFAALAAFLLLEGAFALAATAGLSPGRPVFSGFTAPGALVAQLTLVFGLVPHLDWLWNHPCWSIAVEFWVCVLFASTVVLLRRGRPWCWALLSGLGLLVIAGSTPEGLAVTSGNALFRCVLSFFLGALVHVAYRRLRLAGHRVGTLPQILFVGLAGVAVLVRPDEARSLLIPYAFAATILVLAFEDGGVARLLAARPLVRLGELSFSVYLVHVPIWFAVEGTLRLAAAQGAAWLLPDAAAMPGFVAPFGSRIAADGLAAAYLGLVFAVASWTYDRIEQPARAWSRVLAERLRRREAGSDASPSDGPLATEA